MNNLLFDFAVDKSSKTVIVTREFNAARELVWEAFTKKEVLDQWWAPKPWRSKTKFMDFKEGGRRFYAMVSPEGHERWQIQDYTSITPMTQFKFTSVFADEDQTPHPPGSEWDLRFSQQGKITKVIITIYNESLERMEQMIEMGFREGFTMTLNELGELLDRTGQL